MITALKFAPRGQTSGQARDEIAQAQAQAQVSEN